MKPADPERKLHAIRQTISPEVGRRLALLRRAVAVQRAGKARGSDGYLIDLPAPAGTRVRRMRTHVLAWRSASPIASCRAGAGRRGARPSTSVRARPVVERRLHPCRARAAERSVPRLNGRVLRLRQGDAAAGRQSRAGRAGPPAGGPTNDDRGHADRIGPAAYNQKRGARRGDPRLPDRTRYRCAQIEASGVGESEPTTSCPGLHGKRLIACLQPDRRAQLTAVGNELRLSDAR